MTPLISSLPPPERTDAEGLRVTIGAPSAVSDWIRVDQDSIDLFATATGDDAYIHTDPDRARKTVFGGTIAHGLLTLSLLPLMRRMAVPHLAGARLGVNYGFDHVRFPSPVPASARVRGCFTLVSVEATKPDFYQLVYDVIVELEGSTKPAAVARWTTGYWVQDAA